LIIVLVIIVVLLALMVLFAGSLNIGWHLYLRSVNRLPGSKEEVVITFDDGPHPLYTGKVLDLLAERGIKALFFMIGERAVANPKLVKRVADEGHTIGIHSMSHTPGFTFLPAERVKSDLTACRQVLEEISGREVTLFRPPYGVTNPNIAKAVREMGLVCVGWSIRSFDTIIKSKNRVIKRVDKRLFPGGIILLHDSLPGSYEVVEGVLEMIKKRGLKTTVLK
jgi:peptidoglycan/xylan/chitin deacetylase (PgdA/CDA1 family)